jgi:hypothetical protein
MPTTTNPVLTLTNETTGTDITVRVEYDITFNRLERNLAQLGMNFKDAVDVFGIDPPGSTSGTKLRSLGGGQLDVPPVSSSAKLHRKHELVMSRASLNEDPGTLVPDNDEIRCRIRFLTSGLPAASSETFTNQVILFEDGGNQV